MTHAIAGADPGVFVGGVTSHSPGEHTPRPPRIVPDRDVPADVRWAEMAHVMLDEVIERAERWEALLDAVGLPGDATVADVLALDAGDPVPGLVFDPDGIASHELARAD